MHICLDQRVKDDGNLETMDEFLRQAINHISYSRDEELCKWFASSSHADTSHFQLLAEARAARLARARLIVQYLKEKTSLKYKDAQTTSKTIKRDAAAIAGALQIEHAPRQAISKSLQTTDETDDLQTSLLSASDVNLGSRQPSFKPLIRPTNASSTFQTLIAANVDPDGLEKEEGQPKDECEIKMQDTFSPSESNSSLNSNTTTSTYLTQSSSNFAQSRSQTTSDVTSSTLNLTSTSSSGLTITDSDEMQMNASGSSYTESSSNLSSGYSSSSSDVLSSVSSDDTSLATSSSGS